MPTDVESAETHFYRIQDPLDNLKIRVTLRKVSTGIHDGGEEEGSLVDRRATKGDGRRTSREKEKEEDDGGGGGDANKASDALHPRVFTKTFGWQQKVFGPCEVARYSKFVPEHTEDSPRPHGPRTSMFSTGSSSLRSSSTSHLRHASAADAEYVHRFKKMHGTTSEAMLSEATGTDVCLFTYVDKDGYVPPTLLHKPMITRALSLTDDPHPPLTPLAESVLTLPRRHRPASSSAWPFSLFSRRSRSSGSVDGDGRPSALVGSIQQHLIREAPFKTMYIMAAVEVRRDQETPARTLTSSLRVEEEETRLGEVRDSGVRCYEQVLATIRVHRSGALEMHPGFSEEEAESGEEDLIFRSEAGLRRQDELGARLQSFKFTTPTGSEYEYIVENAQALCRSYGGATEALQPLLQQQSYRDRSLVTGRRNRAGHTLIMAPAPPPPPPPPLSPPTSSSSSSLSEATKNDGERLLRGRGDGGGGGGVGVSGSSHASVDVGGGGVKPGSSGMGVAHGTTADGGGDGGGGGGSRDAHAHTRTHAAAGKAHVGMKDAVDIMLRKTVGGGGGVHAELPPPRVHVFGEVVSATGFDGNALYIEYEVRAESGWRILPRAPFAQPPQDPADRTAPESEDQECRSGVTQVAHVCTPASGLGVLDPDTSRPQPLLGVAILVLTVVSLSLGLRYPLWVLLAVLVLNGSMHTPALPGQNPTGDSQLLRLPVAHFGLPFTLNFETPQRYHQADDAEMDDMPPMRPWPARMYFQVSSLHSMDRHRLEGYAYTDIPAAPGTYDMIIPTWRPVARVRDRLKDFLIGGWGLLKDLTYIAEAQNRDGKYASKFGFVTETSGSVRVRFNVITQHAVVPPPSASPLFTSSSSRFASAATAALAAAQTGLPPLRGIEPLGSSGTRTMAEILSTIRARREAKGIVGGDSGAARSVRGGVGGGGGGGEESDGATTTHVASAAAATGGASGRSVDIKQQLEMMRQRRAMAQTSADAIRSTTPSLPPSRPVFSAEEKHPGTDDKSVYVYRETEPLLPTDSGVSNVSYTAHAAAEDKSGGEGGGGGGGGGGAGGGVSKRGGAQAEEEAHAPLLSKQQT